MGVCVDKKIIQILFCFVIDIYDFFLHMVHEKNEKWKIQATRCQHFVSNQLGGKCNIYMHIFTNTTL
jgi:hypothetical protein